MKITIEIPDEEIRECVKKTLVNEILNENFGSGARFRKEYRDVIKELIYQPDIKQSIIDEATDKAAYEFRRKGMSLLMQKVAEQGPGNPG